MQDHYIVAALGIVSLQALLIGALLVQGARRRRAELALQQSKARTTAILQAIPDLMFVISLDGVYLDYHVRDPRLLFVPPEHFLGKRVVDIFPPDLATVFMRELALAGDEPRIVEYSLPVDGALRDYEARLVACGRNSVLVIARDLTVRKQTEAELREREHELHQTNARNQDLAGRLIASQEVERQRVARELHDDLSQRLALLSIDLESLLIDRRSLPPQLGTRVKMISARVSEMATDVHRLSHELHPAKLEALGLVDAIGAVCRNMSHQHQIAVEFTHHAVPDGVSPDVSLCLYRITQEALHNVVRHSGATRASVGLARQNDDLSLQIADPGVGFVVHGNERTGLGLVSMRERVSFLGGRITIQSAKGHGTRIGVRVPLRVAVPARVPSPAAQTGSAAAETA